VLTRLRSPDKGTPLFVIWLPRPSAHRARRGYTPHCSSLERKRKAGLDAPHACQRVAATAKACGRRWVSPSRWRRAKALLLDPTAGLDPRAADAFAAPAERDAARAADQTLWKSQGDKGPQKTFGHDENHPAFAA